MPTYLSAIITVKNPEKLKEYISQVPATMAPFGATLVFRGKVHTVLNGEEKHHIEAVFSFESAAKIEAWYQSDAYQSLIPVRDEGANMTISILEGF
ncbi:MAG: hypothetical protein CL916_14575 [Deltaproteobacteria bacterium]|nr:hypothetical protein [Deltaproteobacteria bacterium]